MIIEVRNEDEMKAFGARLAKHLSGGEVIELVGDVGSGKTTLTKGIALGLGVDEDVQSPSFTISRVYDARDGLTLAHYDFYRLGQAGIMADEIRETILNPHTVTVIEWGDIVEGALPTDRLTLNIMSPTETDRRITVQAYGPKSIKIEHAL
ncbi:tRNA (adenosine(37)-N6)-threonylcarbamoyltransferase complex ATPase subunit type 1 TsaE [Candidatus Saccharibacteria bacterium]|nr:tRNA (adenosine(37)-N6)-threonylcarbamoyltransferase complex ATPase subunit type 1 TsaE [Candidatus Saccharibacteria bacterium]